MHRASGEKVIAPKPVDLETAGYAVIAECRDEINAHRSAILAKFPGYGDFIRAQYAELDSAQLDRARKEIALNRTQ